MHTLLDGVQGQGHYVGTYLAWGVNNNGWWGEGEIKFYMDGDGEWPTICGTGTEDYFGGAWNFEHPPGAIRRLLDALSGLPQVIKPDGLYRSPAALWHVPLAHHGPHPLPAGPARHHPGAGLALATEGKSRYLPLQDDIASTAFWYQTEPHAPFPAAARRQWAGGHLDFSRGNAMLDQPIPTQLAKAIRIAAEAHEGQLDKAGQPYVLHVLRVMFGCQSPEAQVAAALHDVVEDTDWTLDDLRGEGFSETVVEIVDALTRREGEDYFDFARRAAATPLGREVKRADLLDNMDIRRIAHPTEKDWERLHRYRKALDMIDGLE